MSETTFSLILPLSVFSAFIIGAVSALIIRAQGEIVEPGRALARWDRP